MNFGPVSFGGTTVAHSSKTFCYYASKRRYVANINKEEIILLRDVGQTKENDQEAERRYFRLRDTRFRETEGDRAKVWAVCNRYLEDARTRTTPQPLAPNTYDLHRNAITDFCGFESEPGKKIGDMEYRALRLRHLNLWLYQRRDVEQRWSKDWARKQLVIMRAVFNWAAGEGELVSESAFARNGKKTRIEGESLRMKRLAITEGEHQALLARLGRRQKGNFGQLLRLLWATGARPAEVYLARAEEWKPSDRVIEIDPNDPHAIGRLKTRRRLLSQGRKRKILIPRELVPVVNELVANAGPDGHLFCTENGKVWGKKEIANRIRKLVARINRRSATKGTPTVRHGLTLYSYRHAFVTRWVKAGKNPMQLCIFINTSLDMLEKHYSHLFEDHTELLVALDDFTQMENERRLQSPSISAAGPGPSSASA